MTMDVAGRARLFVFLFYYFNNAATILRYSNILCYMAFNKHTFHADIFPRYRIIIYGSSKYLTWVEIELMIRDSKA